MKSNDFLKVNKKYQKRNGDKSFQQVPRNISNKENFLVCDLDSRGFILSVVSDPRLASQSNLTTTEYITPVY